MSSNERRTYSSNNKSNRSGYGSRNFMTEEEIRKINQMNKNLKGEVIQITSKSILVLVKEFSSYYNNSEKEANIIIVGIDDYIKVIFWSYFSINTC